MVKIISLLTWLNNILSLNIFSWCFLLINHLIGDLSLLFKGSHNHILTKCVLHGECADFLRGQNLKSRFWTRVWTQDYGDIFRKHPPDIKVTCTLIDIKFFEVSDKQNLRNELEMITWWEHFEI